MKEAREEIQRGHGRKSARGLETIDAYDTVLIGSPNWLKSVAPPVLSFLQQADLRQKTVAPFCTHGGGGSGRMDCQYAAECKTAKLLAVKAFDAAYTKEEVAAWLRANQLLLA